MKSRRPGLTRPPWPWDDRGRSLLTREVIERQYWQAVEMFKRAMKAG